jgi:uncharacterized integral membrane protein
MRLILILVFIALMIFFMVFAWQNQESEVAIAFGTWQSSNLPVYFVVLLSFGAGVVLTSIIGIVEGMRVRLTNAKLRRKIKKLESEVDALRNLPLTGPAQPSGAGTEGEEVPDGDDIF